MESIYELYDTTHRLFVCCVFKYMGILLWKMFFFFGSVILNYFVVGFVCLFELNWSHFRGLKKLPIIDF